MQLISTIKTSTLGLALAGMVLMTPAPAQALSPKTAVFSSLALITALSIYIYKTNPKTEEPNRYNLAELKQALKDYAQGINTEKNLAIIRTQLHFLYIDGVCGHAGKEGSPRFNDKTGQHEIPSMPSRGAMGWMHDRVTPLLSAVEFAKTTAETTAALVVGYGIWDGLINTSSVGEVVTFLKTKPAKA